MILKNIVFVMVLCTVWYRRVEAISYSKVYVQQGGNLSPVDYVNYGSPPVQMDGNQVAQIAQLSAAPLGSQVPLAQVSNFAPCVTPCVVKNPVFNPVSNARLLAYKAPSIPAVVVAKPKEDPVSYEYSYVVYDENTGDQKAQRELSDGGVVQGEYSFMQPDGYVREVKYTADDVKGFNAVVKKFLPEDADKRSDVDTKDNTACNPVKNEALQENPKSEPQKGDGLTSPQDAKVEELVTASVEAQTPKVTTPGSLENIEDTTNKENTPTTITQPLSNEISESVEIVTPENKDLQQTANQSDSEVVQSLSKFGDILKCLQAAAITSNGPNGISPLTYVLLPYKGC